MTVVNKFVVSGSQFNMTFLRESRASSVVDRALTSSVDHPIGRLCRLRLVGQEDWADHL